MDQIGWRKFIFASRKKEPRIYSQVPSQLGNKYTMTGKIKQE